MSKLNMSLDEVIKSEKKPRVQKKTPAKKNNQKTNRKVDNDNSRAPKQNVARKGQNGAQRNNQRNNNNGNNNNQRNARVVAKTGTKSSAAQKVSALKSIRGGVKILRALPITPANKGRVNATKITIQARVVPGSQILVSGINKNISEAELKPVFASLGKLTFFSALKADNVSTGKYIVRYADAKTAKNVVSTYNNGTIAGSKVSLTIDN